LLVVVRHHLLCHSQGQGYPCPRIEFGYVALAVAKRECSRLEAVSIRGKRGRAIQSTAQQDDGFVHINPTVPHRFSDDVGG
jgi:hypothetical protein